MFFGQKLFEQNGGKQKKFAFFTKRFGAKNSLVVAGVTWNNGFGDDDDGDGFNDNDDDDSDESF